MSVENLDVIDVVSIDLNGRVVLTIADDLKWNSKHLFLLQSKINTYLEAVANGSLYINYPDAKQRPVVINIAAKYEPDIEGYSFLEKVEKILELSGYAFNFKVLNE